MGEQSGACPHLPALPQLPHTHMVLVSILVAQAAVATGEGHTVGVNVQLTHWGVGKVRSYWKRPTPVLLAGLHLGWG